MVMTTAAIYNRLNIFGIYILVVLFGVLYCSTGENNQYVAIRESLLLVSTLDGSLHAVSQRSGMIKWSIADAPILKMSPIANISEDAKHLLLPDPKDGTLYLFNGYSSSKRQKILEKLPFTIGELVTASPYRTSDGMIYTSKKTDEWIVVDISSGEKVDIINVDSPMCHTKSEPDHLPDSTHTRNYNSHNLLHLFKNEYQISVFNAESREKLSNLTYIDYSPSIISSISQNSYDYMHLTSSTNGKLATIDVANGANSFLWSQQFSSPIVAMYRLTENSNFPIMHRIPFITIGGFINISNFFHHNSLYPSVYIGELTQFKSVYALSALVDYNQIRKDSSYLLEGPKNDGLGNNHLECFGYYEYPKSTDVKFSAIPKSELISIVEDVSKVIIEEMKDMNISPNLNQHIASVYQDNYTSLLRNLILAISCFFTIFCVVSGTIAYFYINNNGKKQQYSTKNEKITNKNVTIGKISYNSTDIIARGCAGTCVYKGLFENRHPVAVKRIVSDCIQLANREIELLRKLQHPHLIRYFATEYDEQFLYIAIELAELTLSEFIENKRNIDNSFDVPEMLYQACLGLAHLHSLNIVHRDIKPQNILISFPIFPDRKRKIMISDFGVSKILSSDSLTTDFSAGTEGWISPEILRSKLNGANVKASKQNDIFSMGCLIFYATSNGKHPFGDLLSRQSNIINKNVDLSSILNEENMCLYSLVQPMISDNCKDRPPIETIVKHPFFWNAKQNLQFLQDVSDRIECEAADSQLVQSLEYGSIDVCRGDWRRCISVELQEDLRKFRSYKGSSVRHLLRAIRNKRHHYHELDPKLQMSLGSIPNQFVKYFTSKFPRLIIHSYIALQICQSEDIFQNYYNYSANGENFQFQPLPRSCIKWFEKLKEDKTVNFAFDVRQRTPLKEIDCTKNSP